MIRCKDTFRRSWMRVGCELCFFLIHYAKLFENWWKKSATLQDVKGSIPQYYFWKKLVLSNSFLSFGLHFHNSFWEMTQVATWSWNLSDGLCRILSVRHKTVDLFMHEWWGRACSSICHIWEPQSWSHCNPSFTHLWPLGSRLKVILHPKHNGQNSFSPLQ